jgi:hypothetical protein
MSHSLINPLRDVSALPHAYGFCDDFIHFDEVEKWINAGGAAGTCALVAAGQGGQIVLTTAATDDDHEYLVNGDAAVGATPFYLGSGYGAMVFQSRFKLTEAATNQATFAIGISMASPASAEWTTKTTAPAVGDHLFAALLTKREGSLDWLFSTCCSADSPTNIETTIEHPVVSGNWVTVEIAITPDALSSGYECTLRMDPAGKQSLQPVYPDTGNVARLGPVKHLHTYRTAGAAYVGCEVRAGTAAAQTAHIDYIAAYQVR